MTGFSFSGYLIASTAISLISAVVYKLLIGGKVRPGYARGAILSILCLSLVTPLIFMFSPVKAVGSGLLQVELPELHIFDENDISVRSDSPIRFFNLLETAYLAGCAIVLVNIIVNFGRLSQLRHRSVKSIVYGTEINIHSLRDTPSFAWMRKIYVNDRFLSLKHFEKEIVLKHEMAHIALVHWADIFMLQTFSVFHWFNPAIWYLSRELRRVHEYQADERVLKQGIAMRAYQELLIKEMTDGRFSTLTDCLNNYSIKSRFMMMKKAHNVSSSRLRMSVYGIIVLLCGCMVSISCGRKEIKGQVQEVKTDTVTAMIVDASESTLKHGDFDDGEKTGHESNITKTGTIEIFDDPEVKAQYPGGMVQLFHELSSKLKYPLDAIPEGEKTVVDFLIDPNGKMVNIRIKKSQGIAFDEAVMKALARLDREWIPAMNNGEPVTTLYSLPIKFKRND